MLVVVGKVMRTALAAALGAGLLLLGPATAVRADDSEQITAYDVDVAAHADGTAHVRETITYDFGGNLEHGIYRKIRYAAPAGDDRNQVVRISGVKVSSDGPGGVDISDDGTYELIKVGDPNQVISGVHTYVIEYDTDHVATKAGSAVRYAWNAIGDEWNVPISDVRVRLTGPATLSAPRCFAGAEGSTDACESEHSAGTTATFTQSFLDAGEGVTVQADLPEGSVAVAPAYVDTSGLWEGEKTPQPTRPGMITIGVVLAAALAIFVYGRARRALWNRRTVPEGLPDDLTPALAARLLNRSGQREMVIGTLLDLVRRGYLRIDDLPGPPADWMLTRTAEPGADLAPYERKLMAGLFLRREQVKISQLRNQFHGTATALVKAVNDELVRRRWAWPPSLRIGVRAAATPVLLLGILTFVTKPLSGYPFIAGALLVLYVMIVGPLAGTFWTRWPGEVARRQVEELRKRLADPAGFAEDAEWALPYAAVVGRAARWQTAMAGNLVPRFAGYSGETLGNFTRTGGGYIVSKPRPAINTSSYRSGGGGGSFGGGFSGGSVGGGGGGGGGGSW